MKPKIEYVRIVLHGGDFGGEERSIDSTLSEHIEVTPTHKLTYRVDKAKNGDLTGVLTSCSELE